jgi:hypothetical protein
MTTQCNAQQLSFHAFGRRAVEGRFDAGHTSTDGGVMLLREVARHTGLFTRLAAQFTDHRDRRRVEHDLQELLAQRVLGIALGYSDLNDHDSLRHDGLLALAAGKADVLGQRRSRERDRGKALASSSTLNRLELSVPADSASCRYKRIAADPGGMDRLLVELFLEAYAEAPEQIWLDLDATDDPLHGAQEGRFFHGYYGHYCYLPLYIFSGEHLLCARLRPANIDAAAGSVEELTRIVDQIRARWPTTRIVVRADSGFCREALMAWCEAREGVDYVLGLAKNDRLKRALAPTMAQAKAAYQATAAPARCFAQFSYQTHTSWSRPRRVVGKAEYLGKGANPRFVVTSLPADEVAAQPLYETLYCARGDMENRIKEQQLDLFADRTSAATLWANQLRLYFASFAYVLLCALRRLGLQGSVLERAQCGTLRLKLLKVAARMRVSVRRVVLSFSESYPLAGLFRQVVERLQRLPSYYAPS